MNITVIIYSILSFLILFIIAKISYSLNLIDHANNRKIHDKPVAFTGGIAISIALVLSILLFSVSDKNLNLITSIAFLICIVGLIDDKFSLNVGGKLSLQVIPIFYLIVFENLFLEHLGNYTYFNLVLGAFVIPFNLLAVLLLINSFNYFDGMDGTLSCTSISVLIILFFLIPDENFKFFIIITLIPILIFLLFNFSILKLPKLFLGDGGSLLLGFIIAFILIHLASKNLTHPILLAWSITIFVFEFLSINLIRLKNKKNPFIAGQDHLHHILFDKTKSIFITNSLIILINFFLFVSGYICFANFGSLPSLILYIITFFIYLIFRNKYSKKEIKIKIIKK